MVGLKIWGTGETLDVTDVKIVYIKQNSELANITSINNSYSWSIKFPKTPKNSKLFNSLGVVGDTSKAPYRKTYCDLSDNGMPIVSKGILLIQETNTEYKINIQDGIIEFINDIGIDKIGETIDLSELSHTNNISTIIASFTLNTYRYLIANYNGVPLSNIAGVTNLAVSALTPSVNVKWLWDKIFEYYNWTYEGNFDISNKWMSYPSATSFGAEALVLSANTSLADDFYSRTENAYTGNARLKGLKFDPIDEIDVTYASYVLSSGGQRFVINETSNYKISWKCFASPQGYFTSLFGLTFQLGTLASLDLYVNDVFVITGGTTNDDTLFDHVMQLQPGDEIRIIIRFTPNIGGGGFNFSYFEIGIMDGQLDISTLGLANIDFNQALIKTKTKDWIKEVMIRNSLTSFVDANARHIVFKTLDERLDADVVDWTKKYVKRTNETYLYKSYAINNNIKHKYNEDDEDFYDGVLLVDNENLKPEQDLYLSFTYAPSDELVTYNGTNLPEYSVVQFKMFETELKTDPDTGDLLADYKALKNRFYFIESINRIDDIYIDGTLVNAFPLGIATDEVFSKIVPDKFGNFEAKVLQDARVHKIELALSKFDVATLDMTKRYFFRQEAQIYILNSLKWENNKNCVGDFVRVKESII